MQLPLKDMLCVLAAISFTGLLRSLTSGKEVVGRGTFAATVCPDCAYVISCSKHCKNCNAVIGSIIQSGVDCPGAAKAGCWWQFACTESSPRSDWSGVFRVGKIMLKICKGSPLCVIGALHLRANLWGCSPLPFPTLGKAIGHHQCRSDG